MKWWKKIQLWWIWIIILCCRQAKQDDFKDETFCLLDVFWYHNLHNQNQILFFTVTAFSLRMEKNGTTKMTEPSAQMEKIVLVFVLDYKKYTLKIRGNFFCTIEISFFYHIFLSLIHWPTPIILASHFSAAFMICICICIMDWKICKPSIKINKKLSIHFVGIVHKICPGANADHLSSHEITFVSILPMFGCFGPLYVVLLTHFLTFLCLQNVCCE